MKRPEDYFYSTVVPNQRQRKCPDCGGLLVRRNSEKLSLLCIEVMYQCSFIPCGATFKGFEDIRYRLKVPPQPNPMVHLPLSPSQKHATPIEDGVQKDCCPECGSKILKQLVATDNPLEFVAYAECASNSCAWGASGTVEMKQIPKEKNI